MNKIKLTEKDLNLFYLFFALVDALVITAENGIGEQSSHSGQGYLHSICNNTLG